VRDAEVVGVVTRADAPANADFRSLEQLAREAGIPCHCVPGNDQRSMADWIRPLRPDVVYCFGWSRLLKPEILRLPPLGVIGYHPAALPRNRGRHPIIWTLALGLPETASTFFFMDEGADSGDILDQRAVAVGADDDAAALYGKLTATALDQIERFTPRLASGSCGRIPQDHARASHWRKRTRLDGQIDWRMSARAIHNLVRALNRPYPGAHCVHGTAEVKIWKTEVLSLPAAAIADLEPGKVLEAGAGGVAVKCGEGVVRLLEHGFPVLPGKGAYL
jgi:methionyl-tRNA formyltransferase